MYLHNYVAEDELPKHYGGTSGKELRAGESDYAEDKVFQAMAHAKAKSSPSCEMSPYEATREKPSLPGAQSRLRLPSRSKRAKRSKQAGDLRYSTRERTSSTLPPFVRAMPAASPSN